MRAVLRSEVYVHPLMTRSLLEGGFQGPNLRTMTTAGQLSEREQEVLKMVALGHTAMIKDHSSACQLDVIEVFDIQRAGKRYNLPTEAISRTPSTQGEI